MIPGGRLARAAAVFVRRILPELAGARNRSPGVDPEAGLVSAQVGASQARLTQFLSSWRSR
jgi:hypothetical protein